MREIAIEEWTEFDPKGNKLKANLLRALNSLINSIPPAELPRGIEKFKLFKNLSEAFDKASKEKVLKLEEREYEFLKDMVVRRIPAAWGTNKNISKAINDFIEAKKIDEGKDAEN